MNIRAIAFDPDDHDVIAETRRILAHAATCEHCDEKIRADPEGLEAMLNYFNTRTAPALATVDDIRAFCDRWCDLYEAGKLAFLPDRPLDS